MAELYYNVKQKRLFELFRDVEVQYRLSDEECAAIEKTESAITLNGEEWTMERKPIRGCNGFYAVKQPQKDAFAKTADAIAPLLACVRELEDSFAVYDERSLNMYDESGRTFLGGADRLYALKNARSEKIIERPDVTVKIMHWVLPTMRLIGTDTAKIEALAAHIIDLWEACGDTYSVTLLAHCNEEGEYRLDLILCGEPEHEIRTISSVLFPYAFGMIGKMGFLFLNSQQREDCRRIEEVILAGADCANIPWLSQYAEWQKSIEQNYSVGSDNIKYIMDLEIRGAFTEKLMQMAFYAHNQQDFDKYMAFVDKALA